MGGYGSGRWGYHNGRNTVEDCHSFSVRTVLAGSDWGNLTWRRGETVTGSIIYQLQRDGGRPSSVDLSYTMIDTHERIKYTAWFVSTLTPWGKPRYWFTCPNMKCRRRVEKLYLAPGGKYFLCRHCNNLTYTSSQESHKYDGMFGRLAAEMPGTLSGRALQNMFENRDQEALLTGYRNGKKLTHKQKIKLLNKLMPLEEREARYREAMAELRAQEAARWAGYLTAGELCERAGLRPDELEQLGAARLLIPDHKGLYRPKLAGWASKLATMLHAGWDIEEVKRWTCGRWATSNPRVWPPNREDWNRD